MEEKLNYKQVVDCPALLQRFSLHAGSTSFPLHHDWGYYRMQGYPRDILSSAICLDACTPESGPLRVIPGTHTRDWPMLDPDPASGNGVVADGLFSEEDRVDGMKSLRYARSAGSHTYTYVPRMPRVISTA